jgi:hypothetical protein
MHDQLRQATLSGMYRERIKGLRPFPQNDPTNDDVVVEVAVLLQHEEYLQLSDEERLFFGQPASDEERRTFVARWKSEHRK